MDREVLTNDFAEALAAEIPRLHRFARVLIRRRGDGPDDLVQETLLRAVAGRARFQPGTDLRAWLFAILRNVCLSRARREARNPILPGRPPEPGISGGQEERQTMRELAAGFARLPRAQRAALWLVVAEGLDYAEAARMMGVPIGTLRSRLSRGRTTLRRVIGLPSEGGGPDPA